MKFILFFSILTANGQEKVVQSKEEFSSLDLCNKVAEMVLTEAEINYMVGRTKDKFSGYICKKMEIGKEI